MKKISLAKKSPTAKTKKRPPERLAAYKKLNRKERLWYATYGPDAVKNPTFGLVLEFARSQEPNFTRFDFDFDSYPKETLFDAFKTALDTGDADYFRLLASSLESVARARQGIYHDRIALELLKANLPPEDAPESLRAIWGTDLVTRKDILQRAGRKVYGAGDGQFRNLDRVAKGLDVILGKSPKGRKSSKKRK